MSGKLMVKTCLLGKHPKQQQAYNSSSEPFLQSIAYQIIEKLNSNLAEMHMCDEGYRTSCSIENSSLVELI